MPVIVVDSCRLFEKLRGPLGLEKQAYDLPVLTQALEDICFEYGLEYDGEEKDWREGGGGSVGLRVEVPANRYDLLCLEGLVDALMRFKSATPVPFAAYTHTTEQPRERLCVAASVAKVRPFCVAALYRDCTFDARSLAAFMDLQDKLHQNLGRKRTLASCGAHDWDKISTSPKAPLRYEALPRSGGFSFVPLNQTVAVDGAGMFELLKDSYLKPYLPILDKFDVTPAVLDGTGQVLSVPPIINSEYSKMEVSTRNVLLDITATDIHKACCFLDVLTAFLSHHSTRPFTVEPIQVDYAEDHPGVDLYFFADDCNAKYQPAFTKSLITPTNKSRVFPLDRDYVERLSGIPNLTLADIAELLPKMGLRALPPPSTTSSPATSPSLSSTSTASSQVLHVECPITRRDILHPCDIVEDVAIAYGFNRIPYPKRQSVSLQAIQHLADKVRREISCCGWKECLTFGLVSIRDAFIDLRRVEIAEVSNTAGEPWFQWKVRAARVADPKTKDFECVRPTLITGLLRTVASNQATELPIRLFEVGDVAYRTAQPCETKMVQRRHVGAIIVGASGSLLEETHGLLDCVLRCLGKPPGTFRLQTAGETTGVFLEGRAVEIVVGDVTLGLMGVVHPDVLVAFGIPFPCSLFEFVLDPFLGWLRDSEIFA